MRQKQQSGFTILELMITVAVIGVLLAFAVPNFNDFFDKRRVVKLAEEIASELQYARTEAISAASNFNIATSGGITVVIDRTSDTDWKIGTSVNINCDPDVVDPTSASYCYIIKDDGDGVIDGVDADLDGTLDAGETDTGDRVLRVISSADHTGTKLKSTSAFGASVPTQVTFSSTRGIAMNSADRVAENGQIDVESDGGLQLRVTLGVLGQVNICSPAGSGKVIGYPDCT